jgi:hypothetical protein
MQPGGLALLPNSIRARDSGPGPRSRSTFEEVNGVVTFLRSRYARVAYLLASLAALVATLGASHKWG